MPAADATAETTTTSSTPTVAGSKEWQVRMRHRARALVSQVEQTYMELGGILYRLFDAPVDGNPHGASVIRKWGYANIGEFAEKELGIKAPRARALARLFYRIEIELNGFDNPTLRDAFVSLGWTKATLLVQIIDKQNAAHIIEKVRGWNYDTTASYVQLEKQRRQEALVQRELASRPDPIAESNAVGKAMAMEVEPVQWATRTFKMEASQSESLSLALKRAQDLAGNIKKSTGSLLALICLDFLSGADWKGNDLDSKLRFLAKIEQSIGLKLIVADETDEVVYGLRALEAVARNLQQTALEAAESAE